MSTPFYKRVRRHLSSNCPVMKRLIDRVGPCGLSPKPDDPFTLLVRCVIGQQISTKSAASIYSRLTEAVAGFPEPRPTEGTGLAAVQRSSALPNTVPVAKLAAFTAADYRACGISAPKVRTLRAAIDHFTANPELLPSIPTLPDEAIREQLTAIKGIGPWTVDMFLMFGLGRVDVWPVGDYGIKVAVKTQFRLRKLPDAKKMMRLAKPWEPYRSVASWYLWRSLEPRYREEQEEK